MANYFLLLAFLLGASAAGTDLSCASRAADPSSIVEEAHCKVDDSGLLQSKLEVGRSDGSAGSLDVTRGECKPVRPITPIPPAELSDKCLRGLMCCKEQANTVGAEVRVDTAAVGFGASFLDGTGHKETSDGVCTSAGARFLSVCATGPGISAGFSFGVMPTTLCGGIENVVGLTRRRAVTVMGIGVGEIDAPSLTGCSASDFSRILEDAKTFTPEDLIPKIKEQLDTLKDCSLDWHKVGEFARAGFGAEVNLGNYEYCFTVKTQALESKTYSDCEQIIKDCDAVDLKAAVESTVELANQVAAKVLADAKKVADAVAQKVLADAAAAKAAADRAAQKVLADAAAVKAAADRAAQKVFADAKAAADRAAREFWNRRRGWR